jgi:hypothetical protein
MPVDNWSSSSIQLHTVYGAPAISFNAALAPGGGIDRYLLDKNGCDMWQELRANSQNVPQEDGSLAFERFTSGTFLKHRVELWKDAEPACDADLVRMMNNITLQLNSLIKLGMEGRFYWTPFGGAARILDYVRLASRIQWDWSGLAVAVEYTLDSPYPYTIDYLQISTTIGDGGSAVLENTGTAVMFPVFKVQGPLDAFTLSNDTTGYEINYSNNFPGAPSVAGGHYIEIDTFRNVAYLDGNLANRKPGIDVISTDFFGLVPGNNVISIQGASVDVLWQAAWQ